LSLLGKSNITERFINSVTPIKAIHYFSKITRNKMKLKSRLSLGLAGIALASGLAGCGKPQFYNLAFEEDVIKVVESTDGREIFVIDEMEKQKLKILDGAFYVENTKTRFFGFKDGSIDEVTFYNVQKGSHFDKYRDFEKLNKLVDYVDDKVKELNQPKAEAEQ